MIIPQSTLEPFGYTGIPFARGRYLMYRQAVRVLEICEERARYWLSYRVAHKEQRGWTDQQLRNYLIAELEHETEDWLEVTALIIGGDLYVCLRHKKQHNTRSFSIRR
jgi:hypothetical protein